MDYEVRYTDSNGAVNIVTLIAKSERGAKREATQHAPAMCQITLAAAGDDYPIAYRESWHNPDGHFGLGRWKSP